MRLTNKCGCPYGSCNCDVQPPTVHKCNFQPTKRGNCLACNCGERFPCIEKDCGHLDCWEERGTKPICHFCGDKLKGENNTDGATWGSMLIRGKTRTAHYCCRDANGTTPRKEIACRGRGGYYPELCTHEFEGKEVLTTEAVDALSAAYQHE